MNKMNHTAKRSIQTIILKEIGQWLRTELGENYRIQAHPGGSYEYPSMLIVYRIDILANISFNFGARPSVYLRTPSVQTDEYMLTVGDVRYNGTKLTTNVFRAAKRGIPLLAKGEPLYVMLEDPKSLDLIQRRIMLFIRKYLIEAEALQAAVIKPPSPKTPLIPSDLFK
jgi:hypothetical protein